MINKNNSSILFVPHGGGPMPLMGDSDHINLVNYLKAVALKINTPKAILVISAHWEEQEVMITSHSNPSLLYDYYGFPPETYRYTYPCPGNPILADKIFKLLQENKIPSSLNRERGFDHGHFVPLKLMYPSAQIPTVQLSLVKGLDPLIHIKIGRVLKPLLEEDILILGSGFSFHNIRTFASSNRDEINAKNDEFHSWLNNTLTDTEMEEVQRENSLINWDSAPEARFCHPREEHLLPLFVCYGAAGAPALLDFYGDIIGKKVSAFLWQ